jgi:hypothetical protein
VVTRDPHNIALQATTACFPTEEPLSLSLSRIFSQLSSFLQFLFISSSYCSPNIYCCVTVTESSLYFGRAVIWKLSLVSLEVKVISGIFSGRRIIWYFKLSRR